MGEQRMEARLAGRIGILAMGGELSIVGSTHRAGALLLVYDEARRAVGYSDAGMWEFQRASGGR